ncbi:MAG: hypothetical protein F9K29_18400 [Hyphomicrobiaceae bacterium]|nr:MAG: hypothetical protein F9K29_18400 [Hyphomicrobiaceae bacterium]
MLTSKTTNKPLPEITDQTRPFWTAAKSRKLVLQRCARCDTFNFHPKPWCVECGCRDLAWTEAKPTGTVYSFTISRAVAMNLPGWQGELPVLMCLIDLDDGARLYGQVVHCMPEEIKIGMRVEILFEDISEEAAIPKFRPAK